MVCFALPCAGIQLPRASFTLFGVHKFQKDVFLKHVLYKH